VGSIRLRLLKWLIGPILLINLAGASLAYLLAWTPAQLAFDESLLDAAAALAARLRPGPQAVLVDLPRQAERVLRADPVDAVYFVVRGAGGVLLAGDADFPPLRAGAGSATGAGAPMAATYDDTLRGEPVRVATMSARAGTAVVQVAVAKTLRKRVQARAALVRALLLLEAVFTLSLVGLIWFSVTNGLLPLARLRARLDARDGADLAAVGEDGVADELVPVVAAFDDLLERVRSGANAHNDFLANVAHQLRTPLAGVKLQLEWLGARHANDAESLHSLRLMAEANERMIRQTNQLLALARAEPSRFEKARLEPVDLAALVAETVQHFVDQAAARRIDLGFELAATAVAGDPFLLRDLISNLVDNAIRYTPVGGSVTVSCRPGRGARGGSLVVDDSGPGIAPSQRELVFARFVRLDEKTDGSGLGLAIVRDIAAAHGATVQIGASAAGGACFTVSFPS
jgi:two-component system sensor histidine kinase TctE